MHLAITLCVDLVTKSCRTKSLKDIELLYLAGQASVQQAAAKQDRKMGCKEGTVAEQYR